MSQNYIGDLDCGELQTVAPSLSHETNQPDGPVGGSVLSPRAVAL
jgi:hypothetical protein